jgi:DNA replication protein DnaC
MLSSINRLNKIFEIFEVQRAPHVVILGNPGIGKTYFGYYMLHYLVQRLMQSDSGNRFAIVYESGLNKRRYLFSSNLIAEGFSSSNDFTNIST